jgi:hypothetical protein
LPLCSDPSRFSDLGDLELLVAACTGQAKILEKERRFEKAMRLINQHGLGALRTRLESEAPTIDFLIRVSRDDWFALIPAAQSRRMK